MPKGPKGEKRPADVIGMSVAVAKIATGESEDAPDEGEKFKKPSPKGLPKKKTGNS